MWKKNKWNPPKTKIKYPKWSYVYNIESKKYYLVLNKVKKEFISKRAFDTWKMSPLLGTTESLSGYANYGKVGFRPGTIVKSMMGNIYYIGDENKKHLVSTPDLFSVVGFSTKIEYVSNDELIFHEEGEEINGVYL